MKVQITRPNVYLNGQKVPVNTVIDVPYIGPALANKCRPVVEEKPEAPKEPKLEVATPPPSVLDSLRDEAEALAVPVDKRWGESRLRSEIASAQARMNEHG